MTNQPAKPGLVMPVADVAASIAFYLNYMECTLADQQPAADRAYLVDPDGGLFLLIGPRAGDLTPHLTEEHYIARPGETLRFDGGDLDARRSTLQQKGLKGLQIVETRWGDRSLNLKDPDGYIISLYSPAQRSPEESLALYAKGPDELEIALTGLSDADFALARAPGEWSIRAIVHHLADAEVLFLPAIERALAESSRTYHPNWPSSNEVVSENLNYAGRAARPSVMLFRVIHAYIVELARKVPNAWERYIQYSDGPKRSFGSLLDGVSNHAREHIDEILEIRRIHDV